MSSGTRYQGGGRLLSQPGRVSNRPAECVPTDCEQGGGVVYLFEKGTSELTVILLLLLSIDTTPPPRFPALPLTLMRSCRNCSWKHTQQQGWPKVTLTKAFLTNTEPPLLSSRGGRLFHWILCQISCHAVTVPFNCLKLRVGVLNLRRL